MTTPWRKWAGTITLTCAGLLVGCHSERFYYMGSEPAPNSLEPPHHAVVADLDASLGQASQSGRPIIVLVFESGKSTADDGAPALVDAIASKSGPDNAATIILDVSLSRNRAAATRFHALETPLLLCLSSRGVIVSRDVGPATAGLIHKRIGEALQSGPRLDEKLAVLQNAANRNPDDGEAQFRLGEFLLGQQNAREAIARFAAVAHSSSPGVALRIHAWVDLVRSHLWVGEPEKGRHEAQALIATLGAASPLAIAGGKLVLGIQDAAAKRMALARREFEEAAAAAPTSPYAAQAREALAQLPPGGP